MVECLDFFDVEEYFRGDILWNLYRKVELIQTVKCSQDGFTLFIWSYSLGRLIMIIVTTLI